MISNEKIAHDLTIIYLSNKYGINVKGKFSSSNGDGYGEIETEHFPDTNDRTYKKVGTGEKGLLGIEKKVQVEDGYAVDSLFFEILRNYRTAYEHFLALLEGC